MSEARATKAKQDELLAAIQAHGGGAVATEATLAAVLAAVAAQGAGALGTEATLAAVRAAVEKLDDDATADGRDGSAIQIANANAIVDGSAANSVQLSATSVPYVRATLTAIKPAADAHTIPVINSGRVWVLDKADDMTEALGYIDPGECFPLPFNRDLDEFWLAVESAGDGVLIAVLEEA